MAGGSTLYEGTVVSNTLKVVGVDFTSSGEIDVDGKLECVVRSDREKGIYRKVAFKEDKVVGCILLGDVQGSAELAAAIERQIRIKDPKASVLEESFDFKQLR